MSKIAKAMKCDGALAIAQITHAGRQTPAAVNANPYSCSDIQVKAKGPFMSFGRPIPLTEEQIKTEVVDRFVYTAKFAHEQGFDGVELHGAHGYLLSSFLSPLTNNRTDKYGGPAVNRMRVVREIFEGIRQEIDQSTGFLVGIKVNSAEFQDYGLGMDDAKAIAGMVEKTGFDFVELSGGTVERPAFHHLRESTRKREAYFFEFAEQLRPCFEKTIVYLTGGFRTARGMVNAVLEKANDGVGLGRPTSAEPDLPAKILSGECLGAPDTKLDDDDFTLTLIACQSQMWQMGKRPLSQLKSVCDDIADLSNPEEAENFKKAAAAYYVEMQKAAEKNEAIPGVLQYQNIAS